MKSEEIHFLINDQRDYIENALPEDILKSLKQRVSQFIDSNVLEPSSIQESYLNEKLLGLESKLFSSLDSLNSSQHRGPYLTDSALKEEPKLRNNLDSFPEDQPSSDMNSHKINLKSAVTSLQERIGTLESTVHKLIYILETKSRTTEIPSKSQSNSSEEGSIKLNQNTKRRKLSLTAQPIEFRPKLTIWTLI